VGRPASPAASHVAKLWIARSISAKGNATLAIAACVRRIPRLGVIAVLAARPPIAAASQCDLASRSLWVRGEGVHSHSLFASSYAGEDTTVVRTRAN